MAPCLDTRCTSRKTPHQISSTSPPSAQRKTSQSTQTQSHCRLFLGQGKYTQLPFCQQPSRPKREKLQINFKQQNKQQVRHFFKPKHSYSNSTQYDTIKINKNIHTQTSTHYSPQSRHHHHHQYQADQSPSLQRLEGKSQR